MGPLNLEIRHAHPQGVYRATYPIERPGGMDDQGYELHAQSAAEVVGRVLSDRPGGLLRVTGVTMMIVERGVLSEEAICDQLSEAAGRHNQDQTWRQAHLVKVQTPSSTVA